MENDAMCRIYERCSLLYDEYDNIKNVQSYRTDFLWWQIIEKCPSDEALPVGYLR